MNTISKVTFSNFNVETPETSSGYELQDVYFFEKNAGVGETKSTGSPFSSYLSGDEHVKAGEGLFNSAFTLNTKQASEVTSQIKDLYLKDSLIAKATAKAVQGIEKLTNLQ